MISTDDIPWHFASPRIPAQLASGKRPRRSPEILCRHGTAPALSSGHKAATPTRRSLLLCEKSWIVRVPGILLAINPPCPVCVNRISRKLYRLHWLHYHKISMHIRIHIRQSFSISFPYLKVVLLSKLVRTWVWSCVDLHTAASKFIAWVKPAIKKGMLARPSQVPIEIE